MSAEPELQDEAIDPVGHIVRSPNMLSGRPRIAGTRVRVCDVAEARYYHNYSPEEICGEDVFPHLSLADVYAALAYYHDHKEEIEAQQREDVEWAEQFLRENPDIASRVGE